MSCTELHTGKLKPIQYNVSIEDFKKWLKTKDGFEVEDFEEYLEDGYTLFQVRDKSKKYKESMYIKYIYNKETLYEMIQHSGERDADFLDITSKNEDGTVDFTYLFYNGGTCFSEMLEEGLNKIV
jgi:hypothetical protein